MGQADALDASTVALRLPLVTGRLGAFFAKHASDIRNGGIHCRTLTVQHDFDDVRCLTYASIKCVPPPCVKQVMKARETTEAPKAKPRATPVAVASGPAPAPIEDEPLDIETHSGDMIDAVGGAICADMFEDDAIPSEGLPQDTDTTPLRLAGEDAKFAEALRKQEHGVADALTEGIDHIELLRTARALAAEQSGHGRDIADIDVDLTEAVSNSEDGLGVFAPTGSELRDWMKLWRKDAQQGRIALREYALARTSKGLGENNELALLETEAGEVGFVHGLGGRDMHARMAGLDSFNGVESLVCVRDEK